jgi:hypothetical protein
MGNTETIDASGKLFDQIIEDNILKNDAALGRFLEVAPPMISKIRHGRLSVSAQFVLDVFDKTGYSIPKIRGLLAS